jgi:hypothetical protein
MNYKLVRARLASLKDHGVISKGELFARGRGGALQFHVDVTLDAPLSVEEARIKRAVSAAINAPDVDVLVAFREATRAGAR